MTRSIAFAAALSLLAPRAASGQVLPHAPEVERLPNGLSVVFVPYDSPGITAYYTLVRTGSRDEPERGRSGFAHLFEHMMFRGTRQMSGHEYERRMQRLGADNNAYTTEDYTLYTVTLPSTSVEEFVSVEADRFRNLSYAEQAFQTETRAVLGEYNKNSASPVSQMWESLSEVAFTRHTYGHTTLGYLRDVRAMPGLYAFSQQFFRRFYTPDNCTIIVAGDFDRARVMARVQAEYASWTGRRATPALPAEPEQTAPRRRDLAWEGTSPSRLLLGYRVPAFSLDARDNAALEVVHAMAFSASSELYQRLVVQRPRLLALSSWAGELHRDPTVFVVEATLAPGATFDEIEGAVTEELARIGRGEADAARVADVVSHLRYEMPMGVQRPADAAQLVARFMALTGQPDTYERYHALVAAVTPDDVARVARSYLTPARRTMVTLSPAATAPPGAVRVGPARTAAAGARRPR
ncbi:MAG: pitrilysin family protein [Polyangiales bacterium]